MSSMSGNGKKANYPGIKTMGFKKPYDIIPADLGGGCVESGPFAKYAIHYPPFPLPKLGSQDRDADKNVKSA
jgi:tyrosinase